jgi:NADH-quinone oxidoreductase subunit N
VAGSESRAAAFTALVFYAATYGVTAIGAFAVAGVVERVRGSDAIEGVAGLGRGVPWLAGSLAVLMLSLGGLPPFAGFAGKFYLFAAALKVGETGWVLLWLVAVGLALSPVALFYYLRVLKQAYVVSRTDTPGDKGVRIALAEMLVIGVASVAVFTLGVFPELLLGPLRQALATTGY